MSQDEDTGRPMLRIAGPDDAVALMKLKRRVDCLLVDGTFLDELYMAMILPGSLSP